MKKFSVEDVVHHPSKFMLNFQGTSTGDLVRWNDTTGAWEVATGAFDIDQINLTPLTEAIEDIEGGMYYNSVDKSVYVCTEGA